MVPKGVSACFESNFDREEEFTRLLVANEQALFNYTHSLLLNPDDAAEVLQDAKVVMWQHWEEFDESRPFFPWAIRFIYFQTLTFCKRRRALRRVFSDKTLEMLAEECAAYQPELNARADALQECIETLPLPARRLLKSRYQHGWTVQEMAERTGRSVHTLYKVLEKLQRTLLACVQRRLAQRDK